MTFEQFYKKLEEYNPQSLLDEIKEGIYQARLKGDISDSKEYDYWRRKYNELEEDKLYIAHNAYFLLLNDEDDISFSKYLHAYQQLKEYALEQGVDNFSFPSYKARMIEEHYLNNGLPKLNFSPSLTMYEDDESDYYLDVYKKEYEDTIEYFKKQELREYIYIWELDNLLLAYYYETLLNNNYVNSFFTYGEPDLPKEFKELKRNIIYLNNDLRKNKKLNFSLYLWTIYKLYWYFRNIFNRFIIFYDEFVLFKYLFEMTAFFNSYKEFTLVDSPKTYKGEEFIKGICSILSNDFICTLMNQFPTYYSDNIIFLGYGLHIPAGCSDLTTEMSSFDSFIKGISDYDYWLEVDDGSSLLDKYQIEKDYDKLITTIFGGNK